MRTRWYLRWDPNQPAHIWLQVDEVNAEVPMPRGYSCRVFDRADACAHIPVLIRELERLIAVERREIQATFSPAVH